MSAVSAAFDALTLEERIALLIALEFEDPARYAEWPEQDTRYYCMYYEVQSELNSCFKRSGWDSGSKIVAHAHQAPARTATRSKPTKLTPERQAIADGIRDFRVVTISRG